MRVVVDANIAFHALAHGRGDLRPASSRPRDQVFFAPFFVLVELYKHKERIQRQSARAEDAVLTALHELCECLTFIREAEIVIGTWVEAGRLTNDVDPKDAPYIALTLHLGAKLWTHDAELEQGLRAKGFDEFWEPLASRQPRLGMGLGGWKPPQGGWTSCPPAHATCKASRLAAPLARLMGLGGWKPPLLAAWAWAAGSHPSLRRFAASGLCSWALR